MTNRIALIITVASLLAPAAAQAAPKDPAMFTAPGYEVKAKKSQVSEFRGPLLRAGRSGRVPSQRAMCGRYGRDVYATSRGRRLPERTLRRVPGTANRFRSMARGTVRLRARCLFPQSRRDGLYLSTLKPYTRG